MTTKHFIRNFPVTVFVSVLLFTVFLFFKFSSFGLLIFLKITQDPVLNAFFPHFFHQQTIHFMFNVLSLFALGSLFERVFRSIYFFKILFSIWILLSGALFFFPSGIWLGFSGIIMGMLAFLAFALRKDKKLSQQLFLWLGLNILAGLLPGVSFFGHFLGAIVGFCCYLLALYKVPFFRITK